LVLGGNSISGGTSVKIRSAIIGCLTLVILENGLVIVGVDPAMVGLLKGLIFLSAIAVAYDRKTGQIIT
jgi:ribose transport system permease protein